MRKTCNENDYYNHQRKAKLNIIKGTHYFYYQIIYYFCAHHHLFFDMLSNNHQQQFSLYS